MAPRRHFFLLASLLISWVAIQAQTRPSSNGGASSSGASSRAASSTKKVTSAAATPSGTGKRSISTTKTSSSKGSSRAIVNRATGRRTPPPAVDQSHPTKDRYAEIQTALAKAGYYSGAKDGNWNDESVK